MNLTLNSVTFSYGEKDVIKDISFSIKKGEIVALLGPNGVGKSTLFKCILGFLKPKSGSITIDGREIFSLSDKERARYISYIPQSFHPVFNHSVLELVMMGLTSQMGVFDLPGEKEEKEAIKALEGMGILDLKDRGARKISGGESQLVLLCRAIVQKANLIIMDEPTASLDFANSHIVMDKIMNLSNDGYSVLFSTHSPELALTYATRIIALKDGKILKDVDKKESLDSQTLSTLYSFPLYLGKTEIRNKERYYCIADN